MRRPLSVAIAVLILAVGLAAVFYFTRRPDGQEAQADKTTVKIGAIIPLTGEVANWGEDSTNGINLALDQANADSRKYHYEVLFEDSKGEAKEAVAAARKLTSLENVAGIIGDNISGPTVAMVPIVTGSKTVIISPSASSPKLTGISPYFFRVYPSDSYEGSFMASVAADRLKLKRVAILYVNNEFGTGLKDVFSREFAAKGGTILDLLSYNGEETDFRPYIAKIKSSNPDGVYLAGYYKDGGAILKQARELGLRTQFLGSTTHEDPQLLTIAQQAAEGFLYPYSTGYDPKSTSQPVALFKSRFSKKFNKEPGLVTALGYDCAQLLVQAVEAKGPDKEAIKSYLSSLRNYNGATGDITFDANGDVKKPVLLKEVKNQSFVVVSDQ